MSLAFNFMAKVASSGIDRVTAIRMLREKLAGREDRDPLSNPMWDQFIRLQMLEGAAKVPYGTWYGSSSGLNKAKSHFEGQDVHPDWFAREDQGLFKLALQGAKDVFKGFSGPAGQDADAIVVDSIMGVSSLTGEKLDSAFYMSGGKNRTEILEGDPPKKFGRNLAIFMKRKAIDEIRKYKQELTKVHKPNMDSVRLPSDQRSRGQVVVPEVDMQSWISADDFLVSVLSGRGVPTALGKYAKAVEKWLDRQIENTPGLGDLGKASVRLYLEKVRKGKEKGSLSEVAEELGRNVTAVSRDRRVFIQHVSQAAKTDRRILKMIEDINLRYHSTYESMRVAEERRRQLAIRVARVFLEAASPRESYLGDYAKGAKPISFDKELKLEGWTWEQTSKGFKGADVTQYGILVFKGNQKRPMEYTVYQSATRRTQVLDQIILNQTRLLEEKERARNTDHGLSVGDLMYSSWGYDETHVNFYEVTKVIGKMVEVRPVASKVVGSDQAGSKVAPDPGKYTGPAEKKKPTGAGKDCRIKVDSGFARPWDGKPARESY